MEAHLQKIQEALRQTGLAVELVANTFNVSQGVGILASKANIDPTSLLEQLSEIPERRRWQIAGYARGVKHVLLEPSRSDADHWSFVESAGSLLPSLEASTFILGAQAAAGTLPWTLPFAEDLTIVYLMHLRRGLRVLTAQQVQNWGVSQDRITSGARSLLYHRTRDLKPQIYDGFSQVRRIKAGDGHDAARYQVIADVFYTEVGAAFSFSFPTPDHFLCTFDSTPAAIVELREATSQTYASAPNPLTDSVFRYEQGKPVPLKG